MSELRPTTSICNSYPLRPGYMAQVVVPRDMTQLEADRLCAFIRAMAQPTDQPTGE